MYAGPLIDTLGKKFTLTAKPGKAAFEGVQEVKHIITITLLSRAGTMCTQFDEIRIFGGTINMFYKFCHLCFGAKMYTPF